MKGGKEGENSCSDLQVIKRVPIWLCFSGSLRCVSDASGGLFQAGFC